MKQGINWRRKPPLPLSTRLQSASDTGRCCHSLVESASASDSVFHHKRILRERRKVCQPGIILHFAVIFVTVVPAPAGMFPFATPGAFRNCPSPATFCRAFQWAISWPARSGGWLSRKTRCRPIRLAVAPRKVDLRSRGVLLGQEKGNLPATQFAPTTLSR